jgi:hypothetical protein
MPWTTIFEVWHVSELRIVAEFAYTMTRSPRRSASSTRFKFKRSFYVRYDLRGIDSEIAAGMVGKSPDEVYAVAYDIPWGWSDEESPPGTRISDDRHLLTEPCPKPIRLIETPSGRLTCFPPDAKAKPNIMSPTFGPY